VAFGGCTNLLNVSLLRLRRIWMPAVPRSRYVLFGLLAVGGSAADLVTKAWVFSWPELAAGAVHWLWPTYVGIQLSCNPGALFGMGEGLAWLFATMSVIAGLAILVWLFWFGAARDIWLTASLGSAMAGILGNLYDRLGLAERLWPGPGHSVVMSGQRVRDWILFQWSDRWRWPNFNIADSMLVIGAAVLFCHAMRQSRDEHETDA
jgi:signal peptidase II